MQDTAEKLIALIADAEITFGFFRGTGLGAVLLAAVVTVFLIKNKVVPSDMASIVNVLRPSKNSDLTRQRDSSSFSPPSDTPPKQQRVD